MKEKESVMRIHRLFLFVFCLVFIHTDIALGASKPEGRDRTKVSSREVNGWKMTSENLSVRYEDLVKKIRSGSINIKHNIAGLRSHYVYTPYYDPFSKKLVDQMTEYAYLIDTSDDRVQVNEALEKYRELVFKHLAHLGVVSYAWTLSRLDIRYGDEAFFKEVRDGIRNSWEYLPTPGETPERAYNVVTYAEEEYLLGTYGATIEKSEIYAVGKNFYDVRDIVTEDGESIQLFFDVTTPIRTVQIMQALREREEKVTIPLQ